MTYDGRNNLTGIINARDGGTGSLVSRYTYTYDNVNNRLTQADHSGVRTTWTYDNINQLTREHRAAPGSSAGFDFQYGYDCAGNRITAINCSGACTTYVYDEANQLETAQAFTDITTYTHDAAGNITEKQAPVATTYYYYDPVNQLTAAETPGGIVSLTYNALGQRIQKNAVEVPGGEVTNYLYDFHRLLQESDEAGDATRTYTSTINEYGDLLSEYDDVEDESYFGTFDAQHSADAWLDPAQTVLERLRYTAFGLTSEGLPSPSAGPASEGGITRWSGQLNYYADPELELYLLGAGGGQKNPGISGGGRYYDPETGRFLAQDPIQSDPNLYRYVGNNPVNSNDPSGQEDYRPTDPDAAIGYDRVKRAIQTLDRDTRNLIIYEFLKRGGGPLAGVLEKAVDQGQNPNEYNKSMNAAYRALRREYGNILLGGDRQADDQNRADEAQRQEIERQVANGIMQQNLAAQKAKAEAENREAMKRSSEEIDKQYGVIVESSTGTLPENPNKVRDETLLASPTETLKYATMADLESEQIRTILDQSKAERDRAWQTYTEHRIAGVGPDGRTYDYHPDIQSQYRDAYNKALEEYKAAQAKYDKWHTIADNWYKQYRKTQTEGGKLYTALSNDNDAINNYGRAPHATYLSNPNSPVKIAGESSFDIETSFWEDTWNVLSAAIIGRGSNGEKRGGDLQPSTPTTYHGPLAEKSRERQAKADGAAVAASMAAAGLDEILNGVKYIRVVVYKGQGVLVYTLDAHRNVMKYIDDPAIASRLIKSIAGVNVELRKAK